jgi:hypothetical protein
MSRSYRKYPSWNNGEYDGHDWGSARQNERSCLRKALKSNPECDVMFPLYFKDGGKYRYYHSASEIRDEYFTEIRNILNGYHEAFRHGYEADAEEYFLHCYNIIRGTEPDDDTRKRFAWLNTAEAAALVKAWKGEPLAILPLLTRRKIIEKAVAVEVKKRNRK